MIIFALLGISIALILISCFYNADDFSYIYRIFYLAMGIIALFVCFQGVYVVYDDSVSGNITERGNLNMTGHNITNVSNIFVCHVHGCSLTYIHSDSDYQWNAILNSTLINANITNMVGFPRPDFDAGWLSFNQGETKIIFHNMGGDKDDYFVPPLSCNDSAATGTNNLFDGLVKKYDQTRWGSYFYNLTNYSVNIYRGSDDIRCGKIRFRLWLEGGGSEVPEPTEAWSNDTSDGEDYLSQLTELTLPFPTTIGNSGGNVSIDATGGLSLIGNASKQEDLRFPSIYLRSAGVNLPDFSVFLNNTYVWLFDKNKNEELFALGQTPHRRANGTDMDAHFHWTPVTADAGDVVWCIEYAWANIDATFVNSTTQCILDAASGVQYQHQMTSMIEMDGSGKNLSSAISARIYRDADNASDDYAFDAALIEFDFHYDVGSFGSDAI